MTVMDLYSLCGSAVAIGLMTALAWGLGFRDQARIEGPEAVVAAVEHVAPGRSVAGVVVDGRGRAALARMADGRVAVVRAVGDRLAARLLPAGPGAGLRVACDGGRWRVRVSTGDFGAPGGSLEVEDPPAWLSDLAET